MYPDQQPQQYSIDYLNQIAPKPEKPGFSGKVKLFSLIGGGVILLVIIFMIIRGLAGDNINATQQLAARLQSTEKIVGSSQQNLKSTELRTLNSNLKILLANTNRDIVTPLANNNIDTTKLDKSITEKESGADLTAKIEDARLNAILDRVYAREMAYQLQSIIALMQKIYSESNSTSLKDFLDKSYKNLQPIQKQFADFSALNS